MGEIYQIRGVTICPGGTQPEISSASLAVAAGASAAGYYDLSVAV